MQRIISRTPLRISFFGGGTDYPSYYTRFPGATLGTSIDKYVYVNLNPLSRFFDYLMRISYSKIELVKSVEEILHPSIKHCLSYLKIFPSLDIHIASDLPAKTGLGSSSSFTVGFLNALQAMKGKKISKHSLAMQACNIEQNLICENVGSQDQFHAAFGGLNIFEFSKEEIKVRPVIISKKKKELFQKHLLIFYTGITRYASEIVQEQIQKTKNLENDLYLQRMYEMVFDAEKIISDAEEKQMMPLIGKLLHESWSLKKQLSLQITNSSIDAYYQKAIKAGAYGGKLCGAGSGGFLLFIAPPSTHQNIRKALQNLLEVQFQFESLGSTIIYMQE